MMCLSGVFSDYNMFLCRKYGVKVKKWHKRCGDAHAYYPWPHLCSIFLEFFSVCFFKKISVFIMWIMLRYWRNNKYNRYMLSVLTDTAAPHTTNVSESS